jgi:hypothetical protein
MANKYLDSTGVKHLWDKIKTWTNSNFQPIGGGSLPTDPTFNSVLVGGTYGTLISSNEIYMGDPLLIGRNEDGGYVITEEVGGTDKAKMTPTKISIENNEASTEITPTGVEAINKNDKIHYRYSESGIYYVNESKNFDSDILEVLNGVMYVGDSDFKLSLYGKEERLTYNSKQLATLDDIGSSGGSTLDENGNLVFDDWNKGIVFSKYSDTPAIYLDENDDTVAFDITPKFIWGLKVGNEDVVSTQLYPNNISRWVNENNYEYTYNFPNESGTFVVANEEGEIELKNNPYNEKATSSLRAGQSRYQYFDDENSQYWSNGITYDEIYTNYYDDYRDIIVNLNAEEGRISIRDNLYGYVTDYMNGEINYCNGEEDFVFSFPTKSGTLATLDDIQEGGTKIQILTWEDDD